MPKEDRDPMEGTRIAVLFRVWGGPHAPQSAPKTPSEADLFAYAAHIRLTSGGRAIRGGFGLTGGSGPPQTTNRPFSWMSSPSASMRPPR
ncbi:MAG TPA: hypothetical protein VIL04_06830, partial [Solirubrobacterales bacterium]